jgi:Xaa-Pro aminopeptidase
MDKFPLIQEFLKAEKLDGWLLADFHCRNTIAVEILGLPANLTRRFFYFLPSEGEPIALIHDIERDKFRHLLGRQIGFSSYKSLESSLSGMLKGKKKIAMEYSARGRLPYLALVDAGTIEMIKSYGIEIVSSADIVAYFQARLSEEQVVSHKKAAGLINAIKDDAFGLIKDYAAGGSYINERIVVDFIMRRFEEENLITDYAPICAIDANISNPHYEPPEKNSSTIVKNSLILIDLWAKINVPRSIFADITWMAFAGDSVPDRFAQIFHIVTAARDAAMNFISQRHSSGSIYGYEIDDACRQIIVDAGYGEYFFHRTGHSILESVHGPGPNIDNLETEDRRKILPGHLFSIEPGIYLREFGFRSEIDVLFAENGPEVTTLPIQKQIIPLFA